jgi:hypothetical protein
MLNDKYLNAPRLSYRVQLSFSARLLLLRALNTRMDHCFESDFM